MLGRLFSTLITALIAGAVGFCAGVYVAPTNEAARFRSAIDEAIGALGNIVGKTSQKSEVPTLENSSARQQPVAEPEKAAESGAGAPPPAPVSSERGDAAEPMTPPAAATGDLSAPTPAVETAPAAAPSVSEPSDERPVATEPPAPAKTSAEPAAKKPAPKPAPKPKPKPKPQPKPAEQPRGENPAD